MKNLVKIMLLIAALFAFGATASARQHKGGERISREQLAEKQARHIAEELAMSSETADKFISTYVKCQNEVWSLGPQKKRQRHNDLTDQQTDSVLRARFDHSQKLLDIRKKYYAEYSKFLTPKQIQRVYDLEHKMMRRLHSRR